MRIKLNTYAYGQQIMVKDLLVGLGAKSSFQAGGNLDFSQFSFHYNN